MLDDSEIVDPSGIACPECTTLVDHGVRFCQHCGTFMRATEIRKNDRKVRWNLMLPLVYFGLNIVLMLILAGGLEHAIDQSDEYLLIYDLVFVGLTILAALFMARRILPLLNPVRFKPRVLLLIPVYVPIALVIGYSVNELNEFLFGYRDELTFYFQDGPYWYFFGFIAYVLVPAIFEELGFRGVIQTSLNKVVGKHGSLVITAILFFFIHLSAISFFWLLPFSFLLCWLRMKYNTLYYGIVLHGVHNFTVCVMDRWEDIQSYLEGIPFIS